MENRVVRTYSRRSAKKPRLESANERPVNLYEDNESIPDINLQWLEDYDKHNVSSCGASERLKSTVEIIKKQDATIKYLKKRNAELQESVKSYKTLIMIMKQKDMVSKPEKIISDPDIPKSVKDICESVLLEPCFIDVKEVAADEQVEKDAPDAEGLLQGEPNSSENNVNPIASTEILNVKVEPVDRTQDEVTYLRECDSDIAFESIKMEVEDEEGVNTIPEEPNYNKELNELEFNFIKSQIETGSGENLEVHHIDVESADNLLLGEDEAGPSDDLDIEDDFKEEITLTETNSVDKQLRMPRNRIRTTNRGMVPQSVMEDAAKEVICSRQTVRSVAKKFDICHVSLYRFCSKKRKNEPANVGYKPHNRVFEAKQEQILSDYVKKTADLFYALSPRDLRCLAYQLAVHYNLKMPKTWSDREMAGVDWLNAFLKRNPTSSVRRPESTSSARAMNFNKENVALFFDNYSKVLDEHKFDACNIYNVDETGVTTVQSPTKIIAQKGRKQVGAVTSNERGTLVTVCLAVSASGYHVPPIFIFPRKNYHEHFIRDGPVGCIGAANGSGWMQHEEFLTFIKHFARHTKPTKENKVLLLLDNHESHLYLPTIEFCRENGIVLLSFPPHTSHKLQPLEVGVYGPFKSYINSAIDSWRKTHPGSRMTIYDIPGIVNTAFPKAVSPANILSGFLKPGIWPFNRDALSETDFAPSEVTNNTNPFPHQEFVSVDTSMPTDHPTDPVTPCSSTCESPQQTPAHQEHQNFFLQNSYVLTLK